MSSYRSTSCPSFDQTHHHTGMYSGSIQCSQAGEWDIPDSKLPAPCLWDDTDHFICQHPPKKVGSVSPMHALITMTLDLSGHPWTAEHMLCYWYLLNGIHAKSTHFLSITGRSTLTGMRNIFMPFVCMMCGLEWHRFECELDLPNMFWNIQSKVRLYGQMSTRVQFCICKFCARTWLTWTLAPLATVHRGMS